MCCDEITVSEDIRVIHDELEKADTWIFAAQEILRPENEEFDPDVKDIKNVESVLRFAIDNIEEAISLCQIYRGSKEVQPKKATEKIDVKARIMDMLKSVETQKRRMEESRIEQALREITDMEKKLDYLKANQNTQRSKLTP